MRCIGLSYCTVWPITRESIHLRNRSRCMYIAGAIMTNSVSIKLIIVFIYFLSDTFIVPCFVFWTTHAQTDDRRNSARK
jgi:hypothetical protein